MGRGPEPRVADARRRTRDGERGRGRQSKREHRPGIAERKRETERETERGRHTEGAHRTKEGAQARHSREKERDRERDRERAPHRWGPPNKTAEDRAGKQEPGRDCELRPLGAWR